MSTLLKAYLMKTDNPFLMFKCLYEDINDVKKGYKDKLKPSEQKFLEEQHGWKKKKPAKATPKKTVVPKKGFRKVGRFTGTEWRKAVKEGKPPQDEERPWFKRGQYPTPEERNYWFKMMKPPAEEKEKKDTAETFFEDAVKDDIATNLKDTYEDMKGLREEMLDKQTGIGEDIFATKLKLPTTKEAEDEFKNSPYSKYVREQNLRKLKTHLETIKEAVSDNVQNINPASAQRLNNAIDVWMNNIDDLMPKLKPLRGSQYSRVKEETGEAKLVPAWKTVINKEKNRLGRIKTILKKIDIENPKGLKNIVRKNFDIKLLDELKDISKGKLTVKIMMPKYIYRIREGDEIKEVDKDVYDETEAGNRLGRKVATKGSESPLPMGFPEDLAPEREEKEGDEIRTYQKVNLIKIIDNPPPKIIIDREDKNFKTTFVKLQDDLNTKHGDKTLLEIIIDTYNEIKGVRRISRGMREKKREAFEGLKQRRPSMSEITERTRKRLRQKAIEEEKDEDRKDELIEMDKEISEKERKAREPARQAREQEREDRAREQEAQERVKDLFAGKTYYVKEEGKWVETDEETYNNTPSRNRKVEEAKVEFGGV